jgi:hypothetical protein
LAGLGYVSAYLLAEVMSRASELTPEAVNDVISRSRSYVGSSAKLAAPPPSFRKWGKSGGHAGAALTSPVRRSREILWISELPSGAQLGFVPTFAPVTGNLTLTEG